LLVNSTAQKLRLEVLDVVESDTSILDENILLFMGAVMLISPDGVGRF